MKITIPIELEIVEEQDLYGELRYYCRWGNFLDNEHLELGCTGYTMHWIVENVATKLADALTPARLAYEIATRLKKENE
jgi:hypothetical protein